MILWSYTTLIRSESNFTKLSENSLIRHMKFKMNKKWVLQLLNSAIFSESQILSDRKNCQKLHAAYGGTAVWSRRELSADHLEFRSYQHWWPSLFRFWLWSGLKINFSKQKNERCRLLWFKTSFFSSFFFFFFKIFDIPQFRGKEFWFSAHIAEKVNNKKWVVRSS